MTKNDFIQMAAIQMSGKVVGTNAMFDNGEEQKIVQCACDLADAVEEYTHFDDDTDETSESMKTFIGQIAETLYDIKNAIAGVDESEEPPIIETLSKIRQYMNNPKDDDVELSALQEIAKDMWDIEGHLRHK